MTKPPTPEDLAELMRLRARADEELGDVVWGVDKSFYRAAHALVPWLVREINRDRHVKDELRRILESDEVVEQVMACIAVRDHVLKNNAELRAERDQLKTELELVRGMKREAERQRDIFAAERDTHMENSQRQRVERDQLRQHLHELGLKLKELGIDSY